MASNKYTESTSSATGIVDSRGCVSASSESSASLSNSYQTVADPLAPTIAAPYPLKEPHNISSSTRGKTISPRINEDEIIKEIVEIPQTKIRDVLGKYKKELWSLQFVLTYPLYFFIYCLIEMVRNGEAVEGTSLLNKCEDLVDSLPLNFIHKLTVKLKEFKLIGFEDLVAPEINPSGRSDGLVSTEDVTQFSESSREASEEDTVDGLSNTSVSSVSRNPLMEAGVMTGSSDYDNSTRVKSHSNTRRGEHEHRRTGSQNMTPLIHKYPSFGKSSEPESVERNGNSSIMEALYAVTHENKLLEDCKLCVKCRDKPRGITFLPCGHFTMCRECAGPTYICSACNKSVLATVDTFLS